MATADMSKFVYSQLMTMTNDIYKYFVTIAVRSVDSSCHKSEQTQFKLTGFSQ